MSYGGRRGVNVTEYIAQLNTLPPPAEDTFDSPTTGLDDDLALFASNDFINWEGPTAFEQNPTSFDVNFEQPANTATTDASEPKMDFNLGGDFNFADFGGFETPMVNQPLSTLPHQSHNSAYPIAQPFTSPADGAVSPMTPGFDAAAAGKKRKLSGLDVHNEQSLDEAARVAAEEDKRRRNTAASARFRIKKKQREQALEKTAKEMGERVQQLEAKLHALETENTWLKSLIVEKNGGKLPNQPTEKTASERIGGSRTDGVGTANEDVKA